MKLYIAGINGLVGSAVQSLALESGLQVFGSGSKTLNFLDEEHVQQEFKIVKPDVLLISAARVGGIRANLDSPVTYLKENLVIQNNLIGAAHKMGISRVIFLGSSCFYPKLAEQPIKEESLLSLPLEPTNEPFAIAKIAGLKLIEAYRRQFAYDWFTLIPCNLYGPRDNFDLIEGHALPSLMHKIELAKVNKQRKLSLWGDGSPLREFMHASDLARAILFLMDKSILHSHINVGSAEEITIKTLALQMKELIGFDGEILFDKNSLNGTPRKVLDSSIIRSYGWKPSITLNEGLKGTYEWLLSHWENFRGRC